MSVTAPVPYTYQSAPLTTDATALKGQITDYIAAYMPPGFKVPQGSMLDLICEAVAIQAAQQADVAQAKLDSDFRYFGTLFGVPPIDAVSAQATCTFTVKDTAGYTINAGDVVGIVDSNGVLQGFDLAADVVIAPGGTTGTGTVVAENSGEAQTGLSGTAQLVQVEPYVTGAVLAAATGGIDAELDATYLNRLVETASVFRLIPVLGADFAVLARSIAGIYRATGVNQLKPGPPYDTVAEADNVDKNVTVAVTDINGQDVGSTILTAAQTYLRSLREDNFDIWVVNPQRDTIDVNVTIYSWPSWDPTAVEDAAVAAIAAVLSPATAQTDPSGNAARWANDPVVYASSLYQAIMTSSGGVRNANPPAFGIHGAAYLSPPTGLGGTPSAGGGTFTAGTFYAQATALNGQGETLGSAEASATVAAGGKITWAWTAVAGATSYRVYRAATSGGENTGHTSVAWVSAGITSFVDTGAATTSPAMPTANTAEVLGTTDVALGAGSDIPALPMPGTITVTVIPTT